MKYKIDIERKAVDDRVKRKEARQETLDTLVVSVDGKGFDADEESQGRMVRALSGMDEGDTISWVLHDNTVVELSRVTLKAALKAAIEEQTRIWIT